MCVSKYFCTFVLRFISTFTVKEMKHYLNLHIKRWWPVLLVGLLLCCCGRASKHKPSVVVSIQPQRYLLEAIVGNKVQVSCLLSDDSNPETYEPDMQVMLSLERSDAYFAIGTIGYELAIMPKLKSNNPDLPIVNTSKGIQFLASHDADEGNVDPHVWVSVRNAKIIARNMYDHLVKLYPKWEKYFTKRHDALQKQFDAMDRQFTEQVKKADHTSFLVWHPTLSYLARDYQLQQISLDDGKEPTINALRSRLDLARKSGAQVLLLQPQIDSRQAATLLQELNVEKVEINPMSQHWAEEMKRMMDAITSQQPHPAS